jgi:hypothetical protein
MDNTIAPRGFPWKGVLIGCGLIGVVGIVLLCGGMVWLLSAPEGGVRLSNQMEDYATRYLEEHQILNSSESLIAYYDVTLSQDGTEAAILTTERVAYQKGDRSTAILLSDITDIRHRNEVLIGDIIEIDSRSGIPMKIEIAPLNQGETFLNALRDAWERSK